MSWMMIGFEKEGDSLTHEVNLDDALGSVLCLSSGERGPAYLDPPAVLALASVLALPFDPARARYVVEKEPPRGWVVREIDADSFVEEIDVDWELSRVFADICGEDLDYVRGPAYGAAFPMDQRKFERIKEMFALDLEWDDAAWFVEIFPNSMPEG